MVRIIIASTFNTKLKLFETIENENKKLRGSWAWVRVNNLDKLYRTIIEEGFTHHASMVYGDFSGEIENFCKFVGISTVIV